jgi:hypothetical protein
LRGPPVTGDERRREDVMAISPPGPATPRGHRNSNADWPFPFPLPGRWAGKRALPANSEKRTPWVDVAAYDAATIAPRFVRSPVSLADAKRHILGFADDVGVISVDHPALAHEVDEDPLRLSARAVADRSRR